MFRKCLATFFLHGNSKVVANYHDFLLKVFIVEDGRQAFGLQPFDSSAFWLWWKQRSGTLLPLNFQALRLSEEKLPMQCDGDTGLDTSQKSDWRKFACEVLDQNKWCLGTRGVASHLRASATPCLSLLDTILLLGNTWRGCYLPVVLLSVPVFYPSTVLKVSAGGFRAPCPVVMCCLFSFAFITRRMRGNDNWALGEMLGLVLLCTMTKQIVQVGDRLVQCRLLQMALSGLEMANTRHLSCWGDSSFLSFSPWSGMSPLLRDESCHFCMRFPHQQGRASKPGHHLHTHTVLASSQCCGQPV